jgi:hypothetical protein
MPPRAYSLVGNVSEGAMPVEQPSKGSESLKQGWTTHVRGVFEDLRRVDPKTSWKQALTHARASYRAPTNAPKLK